MMETDAKKKKYSWSSKDGRVICCASDKSTCTVSKLWEVAQLTSFHDAELQKATTEVNAILDELRKSNKDPERHLSFIQIKDRHFLVWADVGIVGPHDEDKTIRKMLRLKPE